MGIAVSVSRKPTDSVITLHLPKPPALNNLFANIPGKGRVQSSHYKAWRKEAAQEIGYIQKPGHISGPVAIRIEVEQGRADLDGMIKAILDCLVDNGVIDGDGPKVVRRLSIEFADVKGAHIQISHVSSVGEWIQRKIGMRDSA